MTTALVTGASRGIGRAIVELLVERGRTVVACARDADKLRELERAHPSCVIALPVDLSVRHAATAALEEAEQRVGPLHELVLSAGIVSYQRLGEVDEASLRAQLDLNFVAPYLMLQHAGARMAKGEGGAVVAVASTLATHPAEQTSAYAASKAALISLVRSAALELAPKVRVNAITPGVVDTEMVRVKRSEASDVDAQLEQLRSLHPLMRLGTPRDVAEAALYLLDASWATGTVLTLDGGLTLR